jgi:heptosyltransferase III
MRVLLIRPGAIGDCLLWLPILDHLKADSVEIWISGPVTPLISGGNRVRSLTSTQLDLLGLPGVNPPEPLLGELRRFDHVISWYGANRPEFRAVLESIVPCSFHPALPPRDWSGPVTDFFAQQVGAPMGLTPSLKVQRNELRSTAVIHPFSGSHRKNWPLKDFQALSKLLPYPTEWLAGPEENLPGAHRFERLDEVAGWMAGAKLYIGNDSGITHLASALGLPTLALFGPHSPAIWEPRCSCSLVLRSDDLNELSPSTVLDAVHTLLNRADP